jgi:hypothetical protein
LRMTDDEVREENRRMQGDPQVRRQRRQTQQALANQRTAPPTSSAGTPSPPIPNPDANRSQRSSAPTDSIRGAPGPGKL